MKNFRISSQTVGGAHPGRRVGLGITCVALVATLLSGCEYDPDSAGVRDASWNNRNGAIASTSGDVAQPGLDDSSSTSEREAELASETPAQSITPAALSKSEKSGQRGNAKVRALKRIERRVERKFGGEIGIAVFDAQGVVSTGAQRKPLAWSTIKVPIALAAERVGKPDQYLIDKGLKESDNATPWVLWTQIRAANGGSERKTRLAVSRVTAKSDARPYFPRTPEGYPTPYGYARWGIEEQARFAATLPCTHKGERVYKAMGDVVDWQSYGLGRIDGMHFKGGWGRHEDGTYTQRQMGVLNVGDGHLGFAIYSYHPGDGTKYLGGEAALDAVAHQLKVMLKRGDFVPNKDVC